MGKPSNPQLTTSFPQDSEVYQRIIAESKRADWHTKGSLNTTLRLLVMERCEFLPEWKLNDASLKMLIGKIVSASKNRQLLVERVLDLSTKELQTLESLLSGGFGATRESDHSTG